MKKYLSLFCLLISLFGFGQNITLNSGVYSSRLKSLGEEYKDLDFRQGYGTHIGAEFEVKTHFLRGRGVFGVEWRQFNHDMTLKTVEDSLTSINNGEYKHHSMAIYAGGGRQLFDWGRVKPYVDGLLFLEVRYNTKFTGQRYRLLAIDGEEPQEESVFVRNQDNDEYRKFAFQICLRPGVIIPLKSNLNLNLQVFAHTNLLGYDYVIFDVVGLNIITYGFNVGLQFKKKEE